MDRSPDELCAAWQRFARDRLPAILGRNVAHCAAARRLLSLRPKLREIGGAVQAKFADMESILSKLSAGEGTQTLLQALHQTAYYREIAADKHWSADFADLKDLCKKAMADLRTRITESVPLLDLDAEAALPTAEDGLDLLRLAHEAGEAYAREKRERAALDFDDLIHRAVALLTSPGAAHILQHAREGIFALLVDEFQDTDRRQLELVKALCGDGLASGMLFFVGDQKQSRRIQGARRRAVGRRPAIADEELPQPAGDTGFRQCAVRK
jgi:ATP-dependent exoDNAse (exonuclease V) beta subunit